jgi:hypothetical protein
MKIYDNPIEDMIPRTDKDIKIVFNGTIPFHLKLYTESGNVLYFKSNYVTYKGRPTYYEIANLYAGPNKIVLEIYSIQPNYIKILLQIISIVAFGVLIFYKRDSSIAQIVLALAFSLEMITSSSYDTISQRIFRKILF